MDNINIYSKKIRKWWKNINYINIFPDNFETYLNEDKNIFSIKSLYLFKNIFEIENINNIKIINLNNYNEYKLFDNIIKNKDNILSLFDDNTKYNKEIKTHIKYILSFYSYFYDIKLKIISIIKPIFDEEYIDKLFICDDDLTRLLPIFALIMYLYILEEDIEKTIIHFLNMNIVFIQFFIISYLIIDSLMDNISNDNINKKIFFKWFIKLIEEPNNINNFELNDIELTIWQCVIYKKYFIKFMNEYPYNNDENRYIYKYLKEMVDLLLKSDKLQKDKNISENVILEESFKKSYSVFYFIILITHKQLKIKFDKKKIYKLCKLSFLVQIYDDLFDIDKDKNEKNYTYFNSDNIKLDFTNRVKKTYSALFILINEFSYNNKLIFESCNFFYKNIIYIISYFLKDKINNNNFIEYTEKYSFFSSNILKFFDNNSYNNLNNKKLINIIKNYI
jgi:hypothetical protein